MNVSFHPEADKEFVEAVAYYEDSEPHAVFILAVMHPHRSPGYWKGRIET